MCEVVDFKSKSPKSYEDLSIISNVSFFLVWKKTNKQNITNIKHVTNIYQFSSLVFPKYEHRLINTKKKVLLRIRSRWLCEEEMRRSWSSF